MPNGQMRFNPSPLVRHRASIRGDRNGLAGGCPSTGQPLIMLLNLIVLFVHHSSNTTFPGGFLGLRTRPLGRRGATRPSAICSITTTQAFVNLTAWVYYLLPVLLPGAIWLGLATFLFELVGQVVFLGIVTKTWTTWFCCSHARTSALGHLANRWSRVRASPNALNGVP
jgi:hypothetical protein